MAGEVNPTTVLLVDTDAMGRLYASELISDAGFMVLQAESVDAALDMMARHPEVAIVFSGSDHRSGFDGIALAHRISTGWPPARLLIATADHAVAAEKLPAEGRLLLKPYTDAELIGSLRFLEKQWRSRLQ